MLQLKLEAGLKTTGETKARLPRNHHGCCVLHTERRKEESGGETRPVTMAVRLLASTPAVTSSAVDAEPKPDGPRRPQGQPQSPIADDTTSLACQQKSATACSNIAHVHRLSARDR